MDNMLEYLKVVLLVQAFFSVSITMITHALPADTLQYVDVFSSTSSSVNTLQETSNKVKDSLEAERNIPIIEFGAIVFYSGIIILDLLMNFILAVPEMATLIFQGLSLLLNLDAFLTNQLQLFIGIVFTISYAIGIIQLLTTMNSGTKL